MVPVSALIGVSGFETKNLPDPDQIIIAVFFGGNDGYILMNSEYHEIYERLFESSEKSGFAGYDPFDGLNSRIFQATPFRHSLVARLAFLQIVKRSPWNLRRLLMVEPGLNPKGIALFALAELSRYRADGKNKNLENATRLLEMLLELKNEKCAVGDPGGKVAYWGYNFDWQSRAFFAPRGTPTIVPTAFAAFAFLEAYEATGKDEYLEIAKDVCVFITKVLNRPFEDTYELCFSYTPIDKSIIFNASLLAGEVLAKTGEVIGREDYLNLAAKTARFVISRQEPNGSWPYGSKLRHAWVDNFHTAYIINSLSGMKALSVLKDSGINSSIERGLNFWLDNFFLEDGTPKYYDRKTYPVDIHSAAAAIVVLCEVGQEDKRCHVLAEGIARWVVENMSNGNGEFYYQKHRFSSNRIVYMRWSSAWMAFALARFLETGRESKLTEISHGQS